MYALIQSCFVRGLNLTHYGYVYMFYRDILMVKRNGQTNERTSERTNERTIERMNVYKKNKTSLGPFPPPYQRGHFAYTDNL